MRTLALLLSLFCFSIVSVADESSEYYNRKFAINFHDTALRDALKLIAAKGHLQLKIEGELNGHANYAKSGATLDDVMTQIARDNRLLYKLSGNVLFVSQSALMDHSKGDRGPSSVPGEIDNSTNVSSTSNVGLAYRSIPILFASAHDLYPAAQKNMHKGEIIYADEPNNTLIVFSTEETFHQVQSLVALSDRKPSQIFIEAQIIETTKNLARDLGISWGDLQPLPTGAVPLTGSVTTSAPTSPNFFLSGIVGTLKGRSLEAKILAAESSGDAKVISRPKVFTLNNKKATIHSGITYNVKTLAAISAGTTTPAGAVDSIAGGLKEVTAGLQFDVTPTVVGDGMLRLAIVVKNSEPDAGAAVDGIPGIDDNSAETSILVKDGDTATIAGLIKKSVSKTQSAVPWLSHIPILGWFFSSHSDSDTATELMIFITPHVATTNVADASAALAKPVDASVIDTKSFETSASDAKPVEVKPSDAKPAK